eukprot:s305_g4.t1
MDTFVPLATCAIQSVATVATCSAVGVHARRQGLLQESNEKFLDKFVSSVCLPCLILRKAPPLISPAQLWSVWPLLVACICVVLFGLFTGKLAAKAVGAGNYSGLLMTAVAFPNSFSVPMTLLLSIGPHQALLDEAEAERFAESPVEVAQEVHDRIVLLFLSSYPLWVVARWGIGFPILSGALSCAQWREKVLNPPVKASLMALPLGLVYHLQDVGPAWAWEAVAESLKPAVKALDYAGRCTVPLLLMGLGAKIDGSFNEVRNTPRSTGYQKLETPTAPPTTVKIGAAQETSDAEAGENGTKNAAPTTSPSSTCPPPLPRSALLAVMMLRQFLGPLLGLGLVFVLKKLFGATDRLVLMTLLLQTCGPPMINLAVMAGVSGNAEKETARLLLVTYSASVLTWVLWTTVFLAVL